MIVHDSCQFHCDRRDLCMRLSVPVRIVEACNIQQRECRPGRVCSLLKSVSCMWHVRCRYLSWGRNALLVFRVNKKKKKIETTEHVEEKKKGKYRRLLTVTSGHLLQRVEMFVNNGGVAGMDSMESQRFCFESVFKCRNLRDPRYTILVGQDNRTLNRFMHG